MKKILKNIIFWTEYCFINWLLYNIVLNVFFLILKSLDNKIHINFIASIIFIIVTYLISKKYIKRKNFCFKSLDVEKIDIYAFILLGMLISMTIFFLIYCIEKKINFLYFQRYLMFLKKNSQFNDIDKISLLEAFITSVILVPIGEELYFRKLGINFLKSKGLDNKNAILLSALSFGLFHFTIFSAFIHSFLIGLIAGLVYVETDRLRYSILTHGLNNLLSMASALYYKFILRDTPDLDFLMKYNLNITAIVYTCIVLLLLFLIKIFYKRKISFYTKRLLESVRNFLNSYTFKY